MLGALRSPNKDILVDLLPGKSPGCVFSRSYIFSSCIEF